MGFFRVLCAAIVAGFFVTSAVAESPIVLAATDSSAPVLQPSVPELDSQSTDVSVIAPIDEEAVELKGHQAADATLMAAVEMGTAEEVAQAAPLDPPEHISPKAGGQPLGTSVLSRGPRLYPKNLRAPKSLNRAPWG